jgi:hypothetical protein
MHSGLCPMGKAFHGIFDLFQWKHDSNLTMNILVILLALFNDRFGLPPILNIQLDNCWRENKNKYVFSLLSVLVEWSVFDKVFFQLECVNNDHITYRYYIFKTEPVSICHKLVHFQPCRVM